MYDLGTGTLDARAAKGVAVREITYRVMVSGGKDGYAAAVCEEYASRSITTGVIERTILNISHYRRSWASLPRLRYTSA